MMNIDTESDHKNIVLMIKVNQYKRVTVIPVNFPQLTGFL